MGETVKGYKVFNSDWTCRGKQYSCPGIFEEDVKLELCNSGMHFCEKLVDCFNYCEFNPENKVAEVVAYGNVVSDNNKSCTDKLEIVRELTWGEVLDIVNSGNRNSGYCNSGDWNSGNRNSGYCNSGYGNSGDWNSGDRNSGDCNSGDWNSGDRNSGNRNSGNRNSGNWNSGDWNDTDFSSGCFCTEIENVRFFNKPSSWTLADWRHSKACQILSTLSHDTLEWISYANMSDDDKKAHPEAKITGGYLETKIISTKDKQDWWDSLSTNDKKEILSLPNFDADIFKKITGICVDK